MLTSLPALTLRHILSHSATRFANLPALTQLNEGSLSYKELHESVETLSQWLQEQGVGFGDTVAILGENCPHWGVAYFAITTMGAVAVPILTEFHPDAIAHIIRHSEAKVVFVSEKLAAKLESTLFDPAPLFVNLESFTIIDPSFSKDKLQDIKEAGLRGLRKWKEKARRLASLSPAEPSEDDLAVIIYTSGTTGHSKGVMLSHKNIVSNVVSLQKLIPIFANDKMLSLLPLAHTLECTLGLITPIASGVEVFYLGKPPTARVLLPALATVRPHLLLAVPLIMDKIFKNSILPKLTANPLLRFFYGIPFIRYHMHKAAGKKLIELFGARLRIMAFGGAPMSTATEQFLRDAQFPFTVGYGLTETSPLLSATEPKESRFASAGKSIFGVSIRIANRSLDSGEGEIEVTGPNVMQGYFKDPVNTAAVFTEDGWFKTGDLGYLDNDGYVYIKGRSKNMLLGPSGENIYPEEVESILTSIPFVVEALVYQSQGRLLAKVYLDDTLIQESFGAEAGAAHARKSLLDTIREEVNGKVSSFAKIHKVLEQAEPFEKTPTHKIKRYLYVDDL